MMFPMIRANSRNLFPAFEALAEASDRLLGGSFQWSNPMPVDIQEQGDTLVLRAEVPGASQGDVEITVENDELKIVVNHPATTTEENQAGYLLRERRAGSICRAFTLPETAELNKIEANLANGVLTLTIPKKEQAKPRQIQVK